MIRSLVALLLLPMAAHALESAAVSTTHTTASLLSEADSVAPGRPLRVGLRLKMQPGWHTYWLNPGDAGAPPTLDIKGALAGPIVYPTPQRSQDGPFTSFAYTGEVLLPVSVTPPAGGGPLHLQAHATWLVCEKLCVPEEGSFTLDLPAGSGAPGADAAAFAATDLVTPRASPFPARLTPDFTLHVDAPGIAPTGVYFFPAEAGIIDHGAAQPFVTGDEGLSVRLKPLGKFDPAKRFAGVLTLTDRGGMTEALQIDATPVAAAPGAAPATQPALPGLPQALLLAFLGGLILNLMPCVLPVLAMKALALARLSGAQRGRIRVEAALYTAGVLSAFAAIGGITLALGSAGNAAGWGVQFQSAGFTAAMALLMTGIGLNFLGIFEIGAGVAGVGQGLAARGSFFTGLLAVAVATPCTAPFMATALAVATVVPPAEGMAIFLALGAGLAAPYALLAAAPALAGLLPRPGAWMARLRQVLALPMFATAAWLTWVVWHQTGQSGLVFLATGLVLLVFAAQYWGRFQREGRGRRMATFMLVASVLQVIGVVAQGKHAAAVTLVDGAQRYSARRLGALRAQHRPVLVDMSAAWCITCLVNERVAISPAAVRAAMARHDVTYMVGDWTKQDPDITDYLHQFGRNGVPLVVYYPPRGEPQVLPQILTPNEILGRIGG